jgi:hypothetical protein
MPTFEGRGGGLFPRRRFLLLLAVVLLAAAVLALMYLPHDEVKPIGKLSRADVREIRAVLLNDWASWSYLTSTNPLSWPRLARVRLTFRILEMQEEPIGRVTIWPDGRREDKRHVVTVRFKAQGLSEIKCCVQKTNGRWVIANPSEQSHQLL